MTIAHPPRTDLALLLLRVAGGGFLLPHGLGKLLGWFGGPGLSGFAAELALFGLPNAAPLPLLLALLQVASGLCVLIGLFTRLSAAVAAGFIAVTVVLNLGGGWFWIARGIEYPLFWLLTLLAVLLLGPGRWSVDALLSRNRSRFA